MRKPLPLGKAVEEYLRRSGFLPKVRAYQAVEKFGEWFPDLIPLCTPGRFVKGVLFLEVTDPLYLCEVEGRIPEVLEGFKKRGIPIEGVKIRVHPRSDRR